MRLHRLYQKKMIEKGSIPVLYANKTFCSTGTPFWAGQKIWLSLRLSGLPKWGPVGFGPAAAESWKIFENLAKSQLQPRRRRVDGRPIIVLLSMVRGEDDELRAVEFLK